MNHHGIICASVTNHYRQPNYASEVVSQGLLGEPVAILEAQELFTRIRQTDGYESWVSSDQLVHEDLPAGAPVRVRDHFLRILATPEPGSPAIRDAVIGCQLTATEEVDDWSGLALPGGTIGWAKKQGFGSFPPLHPDTVVAQAQEFLGYQYAWGGTTPKGFDCSGLVQRVFSLLGLVLPRDSWQQQRHHMLSSDYHDAQRGDLLFFGRTPEKVTHVAISLGDRRFIHASGWVRCNSFNPADTDYSDYHVSTFISVNRYGRQGIPS